MLTIGGGSASANDWFQPAERLMEVGLEYMMLETIGSVATCHAAHRAQQGGPGYHPFLEKRIRRLLAPAAEHGTTIITNAGIVDPLGAARRIDEMAAEEGVSVQVVAVTGDDCIDYVVEHADEYDVDVQEMISANAYIGTEELLGALEQRDDAADAHVVIGGRIADPSLVVAPIVHEFGWALDDWDRLGQATVLGHLLECSAHVSGGFFADPPRKTVPDHAHIGYPYAEVEPDGTGVITKPDGTGGRVDRHTVREQLFYEVHDPSSYVTPDVIADFTTAELASDGPDRVAVTGGTGRERPSNLKVLIGKIAGYEFEKFVPYGGPNAVSRANVTTDLVRTRLAEVHGIDPETIDLRTEIIGVDGLYGDAYDGEGGYAEAIDEHEEVMLRVAANHAEKERLEPAFHMLADTIAGPAAAGFPIPYGSVSGIEETAEIEPVYVPRAEITGNVEYTTIGGSQGPNEANDAPAHEPKHNSGRSRHDDESVDESERTGGRGRHTDAAEWEPTPVGDADMLYEVAHARAGNKQNISNISVIPYEADAYDDLVDLVTEDKVKEHFAGIVTGEVERYRVPNVSSMNFVLHGALDGGWTQSTRLDRSGKSLSHYMLRLPLG